MPLLVILFFVLAFGTVTVIFYFIAYPNADDPTATRRRSNATTAPLNERMARIHRGSKDVDQPRLEPLKLRSGDPRRSRGPNCRPGTRRNCTRKTSDPARRTLPLCSGAVGDAE